jgi:hypothetical protein
LGSCLTIDGEPGPLMIRRRGFKGSLQRPD